jgi:hypothetical protein
MSPARVTIFAQRVAHTIIEREIAIAHEDDFGDMKVPPLLEPYRFVCLLTLGRTQLRFSSYSGRTPRNLCTSRSAHSTHKQRHASRSSASQKCAPFLAPWFYSPPYPPTPPVIRVLGRTGRPNAWLPFLSRTPGPPSRR